MEVNVGTGKWGVNHRSGSLRNLYGLFFPQTGPFTVGPRDCEAGFFYGVALDGWVGMRREYGYRARCARFVDCGVLNWCT